MTSRRIPRKRWSRCCGWSIGVLCESSIKTYWHVMVDSSRECVRGTIFVQMLIHAVTAERAISVIWIRCGEISVTNHRKCESNHRGKCSLAGNSLEAFLVSLKDGYF